jgi:hypothetical protein
MNLNILPQLGPCGNKGLCLLLVLFLATQCFFHSFINKIKGHFPWKLAAPRSSAGSQSNSSFDTAWKCHTYFKLWQQVWNPHLCASEVDWQWHVQKLAGGCPFPAYEKKSWFEVSSPLSELPSRGIFFPILWCSPTGDHPQRNLPNLAIEQIWK